MKQIILPDQKKTQINIIHQPDRTFTSASPHANSAAIAAAALLSHLRRLSWSGRASCDARKKEKRRLLLSHIGRESRVRIGPAAGNSDLETDREATVVANQLPLSRRIILFAMRSRRYGNIARGVNEALIQLMHHRSSGSVAHVPTANWWMGFGGIEKNEVAQERDTYEGLVMRIDCARLCMIIIF